MLVQCNCGGQPRLAYANNRYAVSCTTGCGVRGPWRRSVDQAWNAWAWMQARLGCSAHGEPTASAFATIAAWAGIAPEVLAGHARPERDAWVWFEGDARIPALHDVIKAQGLLGDFCRHLTATIPEDRGSYRIYDAVVASPAQRTEALVDLIRTMKRVEPQEAGQEVGCGLATRA